MRAPWQRCASLAVALAMGCDYSVWLSDDLDAGVELDSSVELDAASRDAMSLDAPPDAGPNDATSSDAGRQDCTTTPAVVGAVRTTGALEQPTFAVSGQGASLRYGVLVPPAASPTATSDTTLIRLDADGNALGARSIRIESAGGAPASTATVHALSHQSTAEGFLVLAPRALWVLDADGEGESVTLASPPRPEWQRAAGWVDADRFAFVTDSPDLRIAVFDRSTGAVTATAVSAAGAESVHVEPGGVTVSMGATDETVVYAPDLTGAEILRTSWNDGDPLGDRLVAAGSTGTQRIWIIRSIDEFRTDVASHLVSATGEATRSDGVQMVSPVRGSLEGPVIALEGFGPSLQIYSLATDSFTELAARAAGTLVEWTRDAEHVSVLAFLPDGTGGLSLELACAAR